MINSYSNLMTVPDIRYQLIDVKEPQLYREQFPYSEVPKILFDGKTVPMDFPENIWITDTTFRDGQQARSPYTPLQIKEIFSMLHKLAGDSGIIRQSEFFLYSHRDREAVEACLSLGYKFPEITGWIRANAEDFKLVKSIGLKETGILTSVSDYHIFLKLKKNRVRIMDEYLGIVKAALSEGIIPRCHFEDVTRSDIYGFCIPFAQELKKLADESGTPVKIRLCDTMGYGLSYQGTVLPRSIPKLLYAFRQEADYPSEWLEWHGHNDFHKVHTNAATAWLYGASSLNASLLGYGERTGNPPLEAAVIEYIGLKGSNRELDTRVITEIAEYYRNVIKAVIPTNYPFIGEEFNTTRAGVHADGILKNEEIYNIFDTGRLLNRPLKLMITDKAGAAGIAAWLTDYVKFENTLDTVEVSKRHPGVKRIYEWVMEQYAQGRTTSISTDEMIAQAKHHIPSLFESDFQKVKKAAVLKATRIAEKISGSPEVLSVNADTMEKYLNNIAKEEGSIQLLSIINTDGQRLSQVYTQRGDKGSFRNLMNKNFTEKDWFQSVLDKKERFVSDLFFSKYTGRMIITIAEPILNSEGNVAAVVDVDFIFDELVKLLSNIPDEILERRKIL